MQFKVTFDDTQVKKDLAKLEGKLKNTRKALDDVGEELLVEFKEKSFSSTGSNLGNKWRPLSAATLRARSKRTGYYRRSPKKTGQPLVWTGRMQEGFRKKTQRTRVTIDNPVEYFKYHQTGGGKLPQRPMLGLTKGIIKKIIDRLAKHLEI